MKLLFDENLSHRLPINLGDLFPGSVHIRDAGRRGADDRQIWEFARAGGYVIVSKDTDFRERAYVEGAPPKIIWLDVGNASTKAIEVLLRLERSTIERFGEADDHSVLILSEGRDAV